MPDQLYSDLDLATPASSDQMIGLQGGVFKRFATSALVPFVNVKAYGAVGDGATDDATAIQAAIDAAPAYATVVFPAGTYVIGAMLTGKDNLTIDLCGTKLIAKAGVSFEWIISATSKTRFILQNGALDANKANRSSGQSTRLMGAILTSCTDSHFKNITAENTLGYSGVSAVALAATGCTRCTIENPVLLNCGTSATTLPSDGVFVRGDNCHIIGGIAYRVTDTAFVLEGCNHSTISNVTGKECTALAAISNDTASDCVGNEINGVTGSCNYVGSTGGIVGVACFGAGSIRDAKVSGVSIRLTDSATNLGPAIQIRTSSTGRVVGLTIDSPTVDYGGSSGVLAQAILVTDSDDVQINDPYIRADNGSAGSSAIRFSGTSSNGIVSGGLLRGGTNGVVTSDTATAKVRGTALKDQGTYGLLALDTSTLDAEPLEVTGAGTASYSKDAGATFTSSLYQAWTPTYATDVGNAATSFTATPTTTLARINKTGKTVHLTLQFNGTLKAITPAYIEVSLPAWAAAVNASTYSPATMLNDVTYETGMVRTVNPGTLRLYRANFATWSSGANFDGRVSLSFEMA